jgi:hypothetical protein
VTELNLFSMLFALMLAAFVGFQVIQNVSRLLHTPLMSLHQRDLRDRGGRLDHHRGRAEDGAGPPRSARSPCSHR